MRLSSLPVLTLPALLCSPLAVQAQSPPYAPGGVGAPNAAAYGTFAQGSQQSTVPMLKPLIPYLVGILAVYMLPSLLKILYANSLSGNKARIAAGRLTKPERDRVLKNEQRAYSERMANERRNNRFGA